MQNQTSEEPVEYTYSRTAAKAHFTGKLTHYRDLLVRKWWVLVIGAVFGVVVDTLIGRYQLPSCLSMGQMIVNVKLAIPQGSVVTEELGNFLGTQAALMQSDIVVNRAYGRLSATVTNLPAVPPTLRVNVSPRTTIFNLRAVGTDPKFTQQFLQAAMEEYIKLKRDMRKQASDTTVADLTEEVLTMEKELRKCEEEIAEFQGTNSLVWLEEQGNTVGNYLAGMNQRLEAMKSEYDLLQTLTLEQNLQRQDLGSPANPQPDSADNSTNGVVNNNSLAVDYLKAKQQLLLMKAEQQDLAQYLRPKHPKMVSMGEEIARRERLLDIYRQQNAEQLEARKASLVLQIQNLEKDVKDWNARIVDISRKAAQYQRLKGNAQRIQALYQQLLGTVQTLDANKEIGAETVSIMEPASPALLDTRKSRNNLVFAAIGCAIASIALLLFLDRMDDRVNSFTELQELFDEPVLVQIPRERSKARKGQLKLIQPDDERHSFVEAYRNLRSSLLYIGESSQRPRILLLTSSIPSEGKSLTVANLGITLANAGARVLVVDGDLRKGLLHDRFGLDAEAGLCEVLADGARWQDLVLPTTCDRLFLLPRGSICNDSGELFLRPATAEFLKEAAAAYDFVLLDTAPVMAADDVTSLAPLSDSVLFVLRAEHTSARVAHAALDLLYQRNVRVLGIIFNGVRPSSGGYCYYKYTDYYTPYPGKGSRGKSARRQGEEATVER